MLYTDQGKVNLSKCTCADALDFCDYCTKSINAEAIRFCEEMQLVEFGTYDLRASYYTEGSPLFRRFTFYILF